MDVEISKSSRLRGSHTAVGVRILPNVFLMCFTVRSKIFLINILWQNNQGTFFSNKSRGSYYIVIDYSKLDLLLKEIFESLTLNKLLSLH